MTVSYLDQSYLDQGALPEEDPRVKDLESLYLKSLTAESDPAAQAGQAKLFDRRPDWYKTYSERFSDGPPVVGTAAQAADAGLGAMAGAAKEKADYYERAGFKPSFVAGQHKKAGLLGAGAGVLGALLKGKSNEFDQQQARAAKETSMLTAGRAGAGKGLTPNEILGGMNYFKTKLRNEQLWTDHVEKAKKAFAQADKGSPESKAAQAVLVEAGVLQPESAGNFSEHQLEQGRTALMQQNSQNFRADEFDRQRDRLEAEKLGEEERGQLARVDEERRKEERRRAESFVPGWKWANDTPPSTEEVTKLKQAVSDRELMMTGSRRLQEIQQQLEATNGVAAAAGQSLLAYIGDDKDKELLSEAKRLTYEMDIAARRLGQMGVPQQFELELVKNVNPEAGSVTTFFKGPAAWKATEDFYNKEALKQLNVRGLYGAEDAARPMGGNPTDRPAEEQIRTYARPQVRRHGAAGASVAPSRPGEPAGSQGTDVPDGMVAPPSGSVGFFRVRNPDGSYSKIVPLSAQKLQKLRAKYGDAVEEVQ